jgi:hypothetical protein
VDSRKEGGEDVVKAISIQEVVNLSTQIRARLNKEANGADPLEELKQKEPRLAQLIVDIDWILTSWGHQIVKKERA